MNKSKLIFLDVDGVLNSVEYAIKTRHNRGGTWVLDPAAVLRLQSIVRATEASVVLSSTWRRIYTLDEFRHLLWIAGFNDPIPVIDKTPTLEFKTLRGQEVEAWRIANKHVGKYICIDDDSDYLPSQRLVQTNSEYGLTEDDCDKCVAILNGV